MNESGIIRIKIKNRPGRYHYYNHCSCGRLKATKSAACSQCYWDRKTMIKHNLQAACLLFYGAGCRTKEIASRFGISFHRVGELLTDGQRRLRIFGPANVSRWAIKRLA